MGNKIEPSIYNSTDVYKIGSGGSLDLAPFTVSRTKSASPIVEIDNGIVTAKTDSIALIYGQEVDISTADKIVFEFTWQIQHLRPSIGYTNGMLLTRSSDDDTPLFYIPYDTSGQDNILSYKLAASDNMSSISIDVIINDDTIFSNKTTIKLEFTKSTREFKVYNNDALIGTSTQTGPVNYNGLYRPIIGGNRPSADWVNTLTTGDKVFLNETHFYLDDVKQW